MGIYSYEGGGHTARKAEYDTLEYKRVHKPWAIPDEDKPAAFAELFDCDWKSLIMKDPGTRQMMQRDDGAYGRLLSEIDGDVLALDRAVKKGMGTYAARCAMHAAKILAEDLTRRAAAWLVGRRAAARARAKPDAVWRLLGFRPGPRAAAAPHRATTGRRRLLA